MENALDRSKLSLFIYVYAIAIGLYHFLEVMIFVIPDYIHSSIHWATLFSLLFLVSFQEKKERGESGLIEIVLSLLPLIVPVYIIYSFETILLTRGLYNIWDNLLSILMIILSLEATRRSTGWALTIVAMAGLGYAFFGMYIPYIGHAGYSFSKSITQLGMSQEGVLGLPIAISATYVILFIAFGSFLEKAGGGKFFIQFAYLVAGRRVGGPAKTAIISSALMGSVSGSAAANVMVTGTFTIPLMKRVGYTPQFAAAVEACASTGGPMMPPVMAGVGFLMAEYIGVPYVRIMIAVLVPTLLYYLCIYLTVHYRSLKLGDKLTRISKDELPSKKEILIRSPLFFVPLVVLTTCLLTGFSAMRSAMIGAAAAVATSFIVWPYRMSIKDIFDAVALTAKNCINIVPPCAAAGIVAGAINLTGLGIKFGSWMIAVAGQNQFLALVLTAIMVLILGMAIPPIACYVIGAVMCAPAMVQLGIPILHAHFFIFYFAIMAMVTPPVALTSYFAAGLAKAPVMKTVFLSSRMVLIGFVVPFLVIYFPYLLLGPETMQFFWPTFRAILTAVLGCFALVFGFERYVRKATTTMESVLFFISAGLLILPEFHTDWIGFVIWIGTLLFHFRRAKKLKSDWNNAT